MFPRLVLALVFAIPPFLGLVARSLDAEQVYTLVVRMAATASGTVQLFPDTGAGFTPRLTATQPLKASTDARDYHLTLPAGRYLRLRLDPGDASGRFTIERVAILDPSGTIVSTIPLDELTLAYGLTLIERSEGRLVVECPPGGSDPQLVYAPTEPLALGLSPRSVAALMRWLGLYVAVGFALIWVAELTFGRLAPAVSRGLAAAGRFGHTQPHIAVLVAATVATAVAMYPTLFLGRSLVSPSNGGAVMLYDAPPFTPGSDDLGIEDIRGSDVGAMMWVFVPYARVQRDALRSGELPLWNRFNGTGRPLWGQGQSFVLDPLHWLTFLGADVAPGWDLKFAAHRFLLAWGVGVAVLAGLGAWLPACVAAASAPFLGIFAFRFNHPAVFVLTYAPWVLAGWFLLARAVTRQQQARAALMLIVASALVLVASPPKEAAVMLFAVEGAGLLALVLGRRRPARTARLLITAAMAGATVLLLTTPHWLVFLETLQVSATPYDTPQALFASSPFAVALALGPLVAGMPLPGLHALALPLVIAAVASPAILLRHRAMAACLLVASAMIAVAFGAVPESWLLRIPLVANIHSIHVTFLNTAVVLLVVASAAGVEALIAGSRLKAILTTAGTAIVGAWIFRHAGGVGGLGHFEAWLALAAMGGAALVPIAVLWSTHRLPRVLPVAVSGSLAALLLAPGGQHRETGIAAFDRVLVQPRPRVSLEVTSPAVDAIHAAQVEPARVTGLGLLLLPGSQALYRLEGPAGPDSLFSNAVRELLAPVFGDSPETWLPMFRRAMLDRDGPLLDMMNVGYILARFDEADGLGPAERMPGPDVLRAIRRPTAWPRAFYVDRVGTYTAPADLMTQARQAGRPLASVLRGDLRAEELTRGIAAGAGEVVRAEQYSLATNTTTFHVRAPRAGVAVLAESYMPDDFVATLNGQRVPYFRVNHAFKGVVVPDAGEWEVRFEYRPQHWRLALTAAAVGLLLTLVTAAVASRAPRARVPDQA